MSWTDNPLLQKAAVGLAVAGITSIGGGLILTRDAVITHTQEIKVLQGTSQDVKEIKDAISTIKIDVARLEERSRPKE